MHFYDFNIGEYAKKTQHLTNEEDLAYRRLLDMYYDTEKPIANPSLNGGLATLSRRLRVSEQALKNVLDEFFPDGINKHAEEKIAAYYVYIAKQASNGKLGGRPKRTQPKPTAKPSLTHGKPSAKPTLPTNHLPLPTTQEDQNHTHPSDAMSPPPEKPAKADQIPYQKIIDLYHQTLPTLPKVEILTTKRKGQIAARWRNGLQDLPTWKEYFEHISESGFLMGKKDPSNGHKRFIADLEWLTNETNFAKVAEGKYHQ